VTDGEPTPDEKPDSAPAGASRPVPPWAWAVAAVALVVVVAVGIMVFNGDDEPSDGTAEATTTTVDTPTSSDGSQTDTDASSTADSGSTTPGDAGTDADVAGGSDPDDVSGPLVPIGTIPGSGEVQLCAATVDRLGIYKTVSVDQGASAAGRLQDSMSDLENEIFSIADNQEWGDYMVEQLTGVRREWGQARAAFDGGDTAAAAKSNDKAVVLLTATIDGANCPT